jgi:hypothetical protein
MPVPRRNGNRTMTKFGVREDHHFYRAGWIMPGDEVLCRMDPNDKGKMYLFEVDGGKYLGEAICPELAGIHPETFEKARKELNRQLLKERVDPIKREIAKIVKGPSLIERALEVARGDVPNIVALPKRTEQHTTPQIAAALDVITAPQPRHEPKPLAEKAAELHEAIKREHDLRAVSKVIPIDPDALLSETARMFKWALATEERIASGHVLDDATAGKLARFQATGEYQSCRDLMKDFGLENALKMF